MNGKEITLFGVILHLGNVWPITTEINTCELVSFSQNMLKIDVIMHILPNYIANCLSTRMDIIFLFWQVK